VSSSSRVLALVGRCVLWRTRHQRLTLLHLPRLRCTGGFQSACPGRS
jgi:hypothetical protein